MCIGAACITWKSHAIKVSAKYVNILMVVMQCISLIFGKQFVLEKSTLFLLESRLFHFLLNLERHNFKSISQSCFCILFSFNCSQLCSFVPCKLETMVQPSPKKLRCWVKCKNKQTNKTTESSEFQCHCWPFLTFLERVADIKFRMPIYLLKSINKSITLISLNSKYLVFVLHSFESRSKKSTREEKLMQWLHCVPTFLESGW